MTVASRDLPESAGLWRFARRIYARRGVEAACHTLQDRFGLDVNLLLFCLWMGHTRGLLTRREIAAASRAIARWRAAAIEPLRAVRRRLKPAAATNPAVAALRRRILAAELAAERIALARLAATVAGKRPGTPGAAAAAGNVASCLTRAGVSPAGPARRHVAALLSAVPASRHSGGNPDKSSA